MLGKYCAMLFGKVSGKQILVWVNPPNGNGDNSHSYFASNVAELKNIIQSFRQDNDIYVGTGILDRRPEKGRGKLTDITGAVALHLDLDIGTEGHKREDLPSNKEDALALLEEAFPGMPPTMVVDTGNGLHVYYVYTEPIYFACEEDKVKAASLLRAFQYTVLDKAQQHGWGMDITSDLTRVLRPPSTFNLKNEPKEVKLIIYNDCTYTPEDFKDKVLSSVAPPIKKDIGKYNAVKVPINYVEPPAKFLLLLENDPVIKEYVYCTHPGLNDSSGSGMDMGLANQLVKADFNAQEIVDSLVAVAKIRNTPLKKRSYYIHTVATAKAELEAEIPLSEEKRKAFDIILSMVNLDVEYLRQLTIEDPCYHLKVKGRDEIVTLPSIQGLTNSKVFRERVAGTLQIAIPTMKQAEWDLVFSSLVSIVTVMPTDYLKDIAEGHLKGYLRTAQVQDVEHRALAMENNYPYMLDEETIAISAEEFKQYINAIVQERLQTKTVISYLIALGFEQHTITYQPTDSTRGVTSKSYYRGKK